MAAQLRFQNFMSWSDCCKRWYPKLLQQPYFLPPVYLNKVGISTVQNIGGTDVNVYQAPTNTAQPQGGQPVLYTSDVKDDQTQQHVLFCLRELATKNGEIMFVLSQLNFGSYLGKPCYTAAVTAGAPKFPRPQDLGKKHQRGDFDILIIHRKYGLLVCELKSVDASAGDATLIKRILKAADQLKKAKDVLEHIISDLKPGPRVTTCLVLPNVPRAEAKKVLGNHPAESQVLRQTLGLNVTQDPTSVCLFSDDLSDRQTPWDVTSHSLAQLDSWWDNRIRVQGADPAMNDQVYEELVARFAGPATTVEIHCSTKPHIVYEHRTMGEAVADIGNAYGNLSLALFPQQVQVLTELRDFVYMTGPPGTGKTVLLILRALMWIDQNIPVYILSAMPESTHMAHYIEHQVLQTKGNDPKVRALVRRKYYDLYRECDLERATKELTAAGTPLCIIADESGTKFKDLCEELYLKVPKGCLSIWAASHEPDSLSKATFMDLYELTEPLRCPPVVRREVQKTTFIQGGGVPDYKESDAQGLTDGPPIISLEHSGPDHTAGDPVDCETCGEKIAQTLHDLGVDAKNPDLTHSDVFVITMKPVSDAKNDDDGHEIVSASGVVRGLRRMNIPVGVLHKAVPHAQNTAPSALVSTKTGKNEVTVCNLRAVVGLERRVVVWLGDSSYEGSVGRMYAMSRTTAQLVWVKKVKLL